MPDAPQFVAQAAGALVDVSLTGVWFSELRPGLIAGYLLTR